MRDGTKGRQKTSLWGKKLNIRHVYDDIHIKRLGKKLKGNVKFENMRGPDIRSALVLVKGYNCVFH
jgi:hypothetical protein